MQLSVADSGESCSHTPAVCGAFVRSGHPHVTSSGTVPYDCSNSDHPCIMMVGPRCCTMVSMTDFDGDPLYS